MLFTLLAIPILVAATHAGVEERHTARSLRSNQSGGPLQLITAPVNATTHGGENANVAYSKNWSGVALTSVPGGGGFTHVQGTMHIPHPKVPSGGSSSKKYSGSAWVGIDGDTCASAILQTGIDFTIKNGKASFDTWYEWYPAYAYQYSQAIDLRAGDQITMQVTASTQTKGTASIVNHRNGRKASKALTSSHKLCRTNAEWIVERYQSGDHLVNFASWTPAITFSDATAKTSKGKTVGPTAGSALIIDIKQGSDVLTSVSRGSSSVTVSHL